MIKINYTSLSQKKSKRNGLKSRFIQTTDVKPSKHQQLKLAHKKVLIKIITNSLPSKYSPDAGIFTKFL